MASLCGRPLMTGIVIMLGCATFGAILGYPSPAAAAIQSYHNLDSLTWSFYNSVSSLFAIGGPFLCSWILSLLHGSRKKAVFTLAVSATCLWLLNCLTKVHIWAGIVVRAFLGLIMGAYSSIDPMYLVEIAPQEFSGFFGCMNQSGIVIGLLVVDFLGPTLDYMELNYLCACISCLQAVLIWFVDESPALERKNNSESKSTTVKESVWQKKHMPGLLIGIGMMFFQQFCGMNGILTNLASIMNASGLELDGNYQAGIASTAMLIAVFIGGAIMDKFGRKVLWIMSSSTVTISLLVFALNEKYQWTVYLPLICIFCYQLGFGLGMGPIPWFLIPEYFEDSVRPTATSIVSISNWTLVFCIIFIWPEMQKGIGMFGSILFFMAITAVGILFGIFFIHEPERKEPNNTDQVLHEGDADI